MKKLFIITFILSVFIYNCRDKEEITRYVDPELKAWGLFQKGTWWVYEEENTKNTDSFWVDSVSKSFFKVKYYDRLKAEEFLTFIHSNSMLLENYFIPISSRSSLIQIFTYVGLSEENANASVLLSTKLKKNERFSSCDVFKWAELDTIYDSLLIAGNTYHNVTRVYDMCNSAFMNQPTYFYCAKNIGIVRKEFPDNNQVWNLVRYNIIQ